VELERSVPAVAIDGESTAAISRGEAGAVVVGVGSCVDFVAVIVEDCQAAVVARSATLAMRASDGAEVTRRPDSSQVLGLGDCCRGHKDNEDALEGRHADIFEDCLSMVMLID